VGYLSSRFVYGPEFDCGAALPLFSIYPSIRSPLIGLFCWATLGIRTLNMYFVFRVVFFLSLGELFLFLFYFI
jgi:hypothetical protein